MLLHLPHPLNGVIFKGLFPFLEFFLFLTERIQEMKPSTSQRRRRLQRPVFQTWGKLKGHLKGRMGEAMVAVLRRQARPAKEACLLNTEGLNRLFNQSTRYILIEAREELPLEGA